MTFLKVLSKSAQQLCQRPLNTDTHTSMCDRNSSCSGGSRQRREALRTVGRQRHSLTFCPEWGEGRSVKETGFTAVLGHKNYITELELSTLHLLVLLGYSA